MRDRGKTSRLLVRVNWCVASPQESGNPAVDDLRERVAELAGINLADFLEESKGTRGGGQAQGGKGKGKVSVHCTCLTYTCAHH